MDISSDNFIQEFSKQFKSSDSVSILINSAGLGFDGPFIEHKMKDIQNMINLNILALTKITYACIPYMKKGGRIINISSVASFLPQANFAVYAATKAYVLSFSRALNAELKDKGISVLCSCPNPMETEFFQKASKNNGKKWIKILGLESVEKVAKKALNRSERGKDISLSHPTAYFIRLVSRLLPHTLILRMERWIGLYGREKDD